MSEQNHRPHADALDHATAALRDAPVPAGPPADLTASTLAAVQSRLAGPPPAEPSRALQLRAKVMRYLRYGSLATAAAVLAAVAFFALTPRTAVAMDKVLEKVKKAEAVTYTDTQVDPQGYATDVKYFSRGQQTRLEIRGGKMTSVFDYAKRKALAFSVDLRRYEVYDVPVEDDDTQAMQFVKEVKRLLGGKAVEDGSEVVDGVKATVFKIDGGTMYNTTADYKVWVDPKTELPVRISYERKPADETDAMPVKRTFGNFDWNPKLADDLFALDPPKGYTEGIPGFVVPEVPAKNK